MYLFLPLPSSIESKYNLSERVYLKSMLLINNFVFPILIDKKVNCILDRS